MKSVVRMTHCKDGSKILSIAVHMTGEELTAAATQLRHDRNSTLPEVMKFAREGTLQGFDLFLTFLRCLVHNVWLAK